jgi:hypothetical protein
MVENKSMVKVNLLDEKELVDKFYSSAKASLDSELPRSYLGMSEIGDPCERKLWLHYNKAPKEVGGQLARVYSQGHRTEAKIIQELERMGYPITERQGQFEDYSGRFRGHCDGVINYKSSFRILEIKSANDAMFKKFESQGALAEPRYYAQLQMYMSYSGYESALFLVENKNNQKIFAEIARYFEPDAIELKEKARRILDALKPPDPVDKASDCFLCDVKWACQNFDEWVKPKCSNCDYYRPWYRMKAYEEKCYRLLSSGEFSPELLESASKLLPWKEAYIRTLTPNFLNRADIDLSKFFLKEHGEKDWCGHPKHQRPLKKLDGKSVCQDHF